VSLSSASLLDLAKQYDLAPLVILFCFLGIGSALVMAVKTGLHWVERDRRGLLTSAARGAMKQGNATQRAE
jgi:hypothetical protein